MTKEIMELLHKHDQETINQEELQSLQVALRKTHLEVEEFYLSKVAFQKGYTNVFRNECRPNENNAASPGEWIEDNSVSFEFASDYNIIHVTTDEGTFFYLNDEQQEELKSEIETSYRFSVDTMLGVYHQIA